MNNTIVLTSEGLLNLQKELEYLKKEKRPQVSERIRAAKDFGDLSENAEYHEAKEEQAFAEGRILEIESMLKVAHVADIKQAAERVSIGSTVQVERNGTELTFRIVGATEADPGQGKISLDSPLGTALLDKMVNQQAEVITPSGVAIYTIKKIS